MKKRDRVVWIDGGWQPIPIGFCPSAKAWRREAKRMRFAGDPPVAAGRGGHCAFMENDTTGEAIILVCVHNGAERDAQELILTLVHEAVHAWQFLCQSIGERAPGIEMEAYGVEGISRGLIDAYCRTQGKGKVWDNG